MTSQAYCYRCRANVRSDMLAHLSTRRHRAATAPRSTPGGSHAYNARRELAAQAYRSVREFDSMYDAEDPGNSDDWNRAQADA